MKQELSFAAEEKKADNISHYNEALALLKELIQTPSFSKEEQGTSEIIRDFFLEKGIAVSVSGNNVWAANKYFQKGKPTILLNSHHDTVRPAKTYTLDPFSALEKDGKLYGLGSNDAGGCLVALIETFLFFYEEKNLPFNLLLAATAEEEISGTGGIESILPELGEIHLAIVGEPTQMNMAIAERGLLVLDCIAKGVSGHAAREEGVNAIYSALNDIDWFRNYSFKKKSPLLGPVKMSVTQIQAGQQHNVVPAECKFTVDIRVNEHYSNQEILNTVKEHVQCEVIARSLRLQPSSISEEHGIVQCGLQMGMTTYGSPTSSDQAVIPWLSIKIGPGDSARSHTADEFIYLHELKEGIDKYIQLLNLYKEHLNEKK